MHIADAPMAGGNPLADCGLPRFYPVERNGAARFAVPAARLRDAVRFYGRSLSAMQKEAIVTTSAGGTWRLSSDEGAYLNGLDEAPCPLAFMTTGMAASFMHQIVARLSAFGVPAQAVRLVQDNYYTMRGSMPRRTMVGGARPVQLLVEIDAPRAASELQPVIEQAVAAAPVSGLVHAVLASRFTLTANGRELAPDAVAALGGSPLDDPRSLFDSAAPAADAADALVSRTGMSPLTEEATSHTGSSYAPEQDRTLHLRGICTVRADGVKAIEQHLYNPHGSIFQLLSDEAPSHGGQGRAPDANSYVSAGIGFCFMTQLGRFAKITGGGLDAYRVIQDTHFSPGRAEPVETHVYLDTREDDAFARDLLEMGERTCFLHALCRTALTTQVTVATNRAD